MPGVTAQQSTAEGVGRWTITALRPGYEPLDVTYVRGAPTQMGERKEQDPFGVESCSLSFPSVTMYDRIGQGDLWWLAPEVNFDIAWVGPLPSAYPLTSAVWEMFSMPVKYSSKGLELTLVGAAFQLDHFLAKPEFALQPLPYEVAIARCWRGKPSLRLRKLKVEWPSWWTETYKPVLRQRPELIPTGVVADQYWTGLLTRETGSFEPTLTSYIQTLLATMYTSRGRWTLEMRPGRQPVLMHRDFKYESGTGVVKVDPMAPGVTVDLQEDWTQSANVYFGQAKSLSGEAYSGLQVVGDGQAYVYKPLAALRQVEPVNDRNTWLQQSRMRKEAVLQLQDGLTALDAAKVGQSQLQHFSDPGLTGSITLSSDVHMVSATGVLEPMHRALVRAGMSVHLPGFKGNAEGVFLHVVDTSFSYDSGTMTLTVDSKYRDKLTVDEVKLRGRDAMSVPRMLLGGKYNPPLPDMLFPWNYGEGAGYIPSSPAYSARRLFEDMPGDVDFPWTEWTTQRPPKSSSWKSAYIRITPKSANADNNWCAVPNRLSKTATNAAGKYGFPIKMSQAGTINLLQLAAYDLDGNVMPVGFHFSLYYQRDVNVQSMPKIPAIYAGADAGGYPAGEHYPFFTQAWETFNLNGTRVGTEVPVAVQSAGLIQGWGTRTVKAGYWPGSSADGDAKTGLLVDETPFTWSTIDQTPHIGQYAVNDLAPYAGYLYCMIYCDEQLADDVFFLGRMYRQTPGSVV